MSTTNNPTAATTTPSTTTPSATTPSATTTSSASPTSSGTGSSTTPAVTPPQSPVAVSTGDVTAKTKHTKESEELENEINKTSKRKFSFKNVEMDKEKVKVAIETLNAAFDKTAAESQVAGILKKKFDELYADPWHTIVGRKFGTRVSHEPGSFLHLHVDGQAVILFKSRLPMPKKATPAPAKTTP